MSARDISADVDRGLYLLARIDALKAELAQIEARLEKAGLEGDQIELVDPEREGRQFLAKGSEAIVPVVFTADLLVKSFSDGSDTALKISQSLRDHSLGRFFRRVVTWKALIDSGKQFRKEASEWLGPDAPQFISACLQRDKHGIPKSQVKIEWSRAVARASSLQPNEEAA